jgi:hypothetical protein
MGSRYLQWNGKNPYFGQNFGDLRGAVTVILQCKVNPHMLQTEAIFFKFVGCLDNQTDDKFSM